MRASLPAQVRLEVATDPDDYRILLLASVHQGVECITKHPVRYPRSMINPNFSAQASMPNELVHAKPPCLADSDKVNQFVNDDGHT